MHRHSEARRIEKQRNKAATLCMVLHMLASAHAYPLRADLTTFLQTKEYDGETCDGSVVSFTALRIGVCRAEPSGSMRVMCGSSKACGIQLYTAAGSNCSGRASLASQVLPLYTCNVNASRYRNRSVIATVVSEDSARDGMPLPVVATHTSSACTGEAASYTSMGLCAPGSGDEWTRFSCQPIPWAQSRTALPMGDESAERCTYNDEQCSSNRRIGRAHV